MTAPTDGFRAHVADRYRFERELGSGGMATVYLAEDLKHRRRVAIKVLRPELTVVLGAQRFLKEIEVTANLQHPHVLPLFDSGEADGLLYYVMPYVEGESLRAKLTRERQLTVDEALRITLQVASALDYAHRHGVIHRDIKPENVLLHEGQALVADFGIALALREAGGERLTQTGLSLGTPQYVSPEQASGDVAVDARSDVYSLAAVLYEMLAGEPPHTGPTAQAVLAKLMLDRVRPINELRATVPPHVAGALQVALATLAADRWASAHAFAEALQGRLAELPAGIGARASIGNQAIAGDKQSRRRVLVGLPWLIAAIAVSVAVAVSWARSGAAERDVMRFALSAADSLTITETPLISPDGRALLFQARNRQGVTRLFYRRFAELDARPLPGTESASNPSFSRDGRIVAFAAGGRVKVVPVDGSDAVVLGAYRVRNGIAWVGDETLLLSSFDGGLVRVGARGGPATRLTALDSTRGEIFHTDPIVIEDGTWAVFTIWDRAFARSLGVVRVGGGEVRRIGGATGELLGVSDGWVVFVREDGTIAAAPFDPATTQDVSGAVVVLDGVRQRANTGAYASLSVDGSLVYARRQDAPDSLIVRDATGQGVAALPERMGVADPQYSPDGTKLAVTVGRDAATSIWILDLAARTSERLTSIDRSRRPAWSADGKRVAFVAPNRDGLDAAWWVAADRSGPPELLGVTPNAVAEVAFSPDNRYAVLRTGRDPSSGRDLWIIPLDGDRRATPLLRTPGDQNHPAVSPDGRHLALVSNEGAGSKVYVRAFPNGGPMVGVSGVGGREPQWARDGRLYYRTIDSLFRVTLRLEGTPMVLRSEGLFAISTPLGDGRPQYGVHPNGQHFVTVRPATASTLDFVVVRNWRSELRETLAGIGGRRTK